MLQLSQRPLTAATVDAALFTDRAIELGQLARAVDLRLNTLVLGDRGTGKTSLLRQLEHRLVDGPLEVVFVDGEDASDAASFFHRVDDTVSRRETVPVVPPLSTSALLRRLGAVFSEPTVVIIDDIPADVAHTVFGRYRDDLWEIPVVWIVAGPSTSRARFLAPPADAFFDVVLDLAELSEEAARELLLRRALAAGDDDAAAGLRQAAARIARDTTPRTPRALLAAARRVLLDGGEQGAGIDHVPMMQRRAAEIGRPAAMLFTELLERGPVSASDTEFLRVLGWTRPRVVQVLKQLEAAGLVTTSTVAGGKGRPRTLYGVNRAYEGGEH